MKTTRRPGASEEVELEPWLRTVRHLRERGLEPVVPVAVAWRLYEAYGLRVSSRVELWSRAA